MKYEQLSEMFKKQNNPKEKEINELKVKIKQLEGQLSNSNSSLR